MSGESESFDVYPNTEGILSVKQKLKENACKDEVLFFNLDFSECVLRHNPLINIITLQVKGQWKFLRIGKVNSIIYTVSSEDGQPRIDCCINLGFTSVVTDLVVKSIHFSMHSCQNQIRSCFTEAIEAAKSKPPALKITCNRFSITYVTHGVPDHIKMIQTKCQFMLPFITVEGLLERKCWMEKEKTNCRDLIACLDYLIEKYLTTSQAPNSNCRFILNGNKEMAEIVSFTPNSLARKEYVVMCGKSSEVSIYPPLG